MNTESSDWYEEMCKRVKVELAKKTMESLKTSEHRLYAVYFDNGRIKVGYTSNFAKRIKYFEQEARRHGGSELRYWASAGLPSRERARELEWLLILGSHRWVEDAGYEIGFVPRHREWFTGTPECFSAITKCASMARADCGGDSDFSQAVVAQFDIEGVCRI